MSIEPIVRFATVKAPPARAFEVFATQMGRWWKVGTTMGRNPHVAIALEPKVGGRWFERDAAGNEIEWGRVLAWEPPARLLLAWQISSQMKYDPDFLTELELTFARTESSGTLVTLEHRDLERYGAEAGKFASMLGTGWQRHLNELAESI